MEEYRSVHDFGQAVLGKIDLLVDICRRQPDLRLNADDVPLARVVAAMTSETVDAAESTALLLRQPLVADACNAARRALEHSVTAAWMANRQSSVEEFARETGLRQAVAFKNALTKAGVEIDPGLLAEVPQEGDIPPRTDPEQAMKWLEKRCATFHPKLYVLYRLLSSVSHPSALTVYRAYILAEDNRREVEQIQDAVIVVAALAAAASTAWAANALHRLDAEPPDKYLKEMRRVEDIARHLGFAPTLLPDMPDNGLWPI